MKAEVALIPQHLIAEEEQAQARVTHLILYCLHLRNVAQHLAIPKMEMTLRKKNSKSK